MAEKYHLENRKKSGYLKNHLTDFQEILFADAHYACRLYVSEKN